MPSPENLLPPGQIILGSRTPRKPAWLRETPALGDLRYQLFSGVAGPLAAAEPGDVAVFAVYEFATALTTREKCDENKKALAKFVRDVIGASVPVDDWWLLGPFHVPSDRWARIPLFIGHLTTPGAPA
jgi:hypothetical protein